MQIKQFGACLCFSVFPQGPVMPNITVDPAGVVHNKDNTCFIGHKWTVYKKPPAFPNTPIHFLYVRTFHSFLWLQYWQEIAGRHRCNLTKFVGVKSHLVLQSLSKEPTSTRAATGLLGIHQIWLLARRMGLLNGPSCGRVDIFWCLPCFIMNYMSSQCISLDKHCFQHSGRFSNDLILQLKYALMFLKTF